MGIDLVAEFALRHIVLYSTSLPIARNLSFDVF